MLIVIGEIKLKNRTYLLPYLKLTINLCHHFYSDRINANSNFL